MRHSTALVVLWSASTWADPGAVNPVAPQSADLLSAEEGLFALEEELVTAASRSPEPVRLAPASVTIIDRREIDAFAYATVAEALQGVRGLYQTDDRFYVSLGVRGFNRFGDYGNRLQVQVDGHVMNDDWISSSYIGNDHATDLEHVEQIEVVRGPGSTLYGTGAFFGVINVITPKVAPSYTLRTSATLLDFGSVRAHVDGGHRFDNGAGFWLSLGTSTRPGQDLQQDAYQGTPWAPDGNAVGVDAFSTGTLNAKAFWGDFTLQGSFHQRNRRIPTATFGTALGDRRNIGNDARAFVELRYEPLVFDGAQLFSRIYVDGQGYEGFYAYTDPVFSPSRETYEALWTGAEARVQMHLLPELQGTAGVEAQVHPFNHWFAKDDPAPEPYVDQSVFFAYLSAYALSDWAPTPWLHLHAGLRFDSWIINVPAGAPPEPPGFLPSLNPRLAAIWLPSDDDTVKLMLGRSYRVPSLYELAGQPGGFSFQSDGRLQPETIYTGELEYRRHLPSDSTLVLSTYVNRVSDLLNYISAATPNDIEGFTNVADPLWTLGAEGELRHQSREGVAAAVQVSLQRTRLNDPFGDSVVPNSPEQTGAAWLLLPLGPEGSLNWANRVVVDMGRLDRLGATTDPFVLVDSTLSGTLPTPPPVRWAVGVRNLFDVRYEHPVSDRLLASRLLQDGRTVRVDVSVVF